MTTQRFDKTANHYGATDDIAGGLARSAYSYYGSVIRSTGDGSKSASGVKRVFAAAMLSGVSVMAFGLAAPDRAAAGSCVGPVNETVVCAGTFDDTIEYDVDVDDVTIVLSAGSLIDTTENTSEFDHDNAGIVVTGESDVGIINNGSIFTGDNQSYVEVGEDDGFFAYLGDGHHGIAAYSDFGTASATNSATGVIATTSEASHGALASSYYEAAEVANAGLIVTEGDNAFGIAAYAKYDIEVVNSGTISTDGEDSAGIFASIDSFDEEWADEGAMVRIDNSGGIETSGSGAAGIRVDTDRSTTVEIVNSGTIETTGEYSDGIAAAAWEGSVDVENSGSISTEGYGAHAVAIYGDTVSLDNSGTISTSGEEAHAVVAYSGGLATTTIVNTGSIEATGDEADAIRAGGPTVVITNTFIEEDDEVVAYGVISSEDGAAIRVEESGDARLYNHAGIYGNVSIEAEDYALVENSGSIVADREYTAVVALHVESGNAVAINDEGGTITSYADHSNAVEAIAEEGIADVRNYGSITTGHVEGMDEVIGHSSIGAAAYGFDGALAVNAGSVQTIGGGAYGILASSSDGTAQAVNTGTIETSGDDAHGVVATAPDGQVYVGYDEYLHEYIFEDVLGHAIASNAGDVTTSGENAFGVVAQSGYGDALAYSIYGGSIVTSGTGAHGLVAITGWEIDEIGEYGSEAGGDAIAINGLAGEMGYFFGEGFAGESHIIMPDLVDTDAFDPADFRSTIVTSGDGAVGVLADAEGGTAMAGNIYGTITTGTMDEEGDPLTGSGAHGIAAIASDEEGNAFAVNKYAGHVTTHGSGAIGVLAQSYGGEAIAANGLTSTVETFGGNAHGVHAFSDGGDAVALNKYSSSIVTHGDEAIGLFASSEGESGEYSSADGLAYNFGSTITTYGEGSHGIYAYSEEGDAVAVNASIVNEGEEGEDDEIIVARIETHGAGAHGILAYSHSYDVHATNSGEIVTYGDDAIGIRVEASDDADIENSGSISTSGEYAHGIDVDAYDRIEVINSGSVVVTGYEANGIVAHSNGEYGEVVIANSGLVHVQGEYGDAIRASGGSVTVTNAEGGEILSDDSDGIDIHDSGTVRVYNSGTISGDESAIEIDESTDVGIYNYASIIGRVDVEESESVYFLNDEDATVSVESETAVGVRLIAFAEAVAVNRGSIETTGDGTDGIELRGSTVSLDNSGTISTSGAEAHAVVANSFLPATTTILNSGTIEATGKYADAIQASGPSVFITNTEDGIVSSGDSAAIRAFDAKYVSILNYGQIVGDVLVSAYNYEDFGSTYILNSGSVSGDIDTSGGESDDTIVIASGTVGGAIFTGDGEDDVTISGTGVSIAKGIHGDEEGDLHINFEQEDTVTFADGIEGYAISNAHFVGFYSGTTVFDGVDIHTNDEGSIFVGEDATLATTAEGAYAVVDDVSIDGRLRIAAGSGFGFSGDVGFNEGSTFETGLGGDGAGVVSGNTVHFDAGSTIHVATVGGFTQSVGQDVLIASAGAENGVTDDGAAVTDNLILFRFLKVMNDEVVTDGAADDLFLRIEVEETAFDLETEADGTANLLSMAAALDVYIQSQPIDNPLVQYLLEFETEEEQLAALLRVIKDTLLEETAGSVGGTMASTDLIYDMIMDRLSGGGFAVADNGMTGVSAGDEVLGGDGRWALWGRVGASRATFTPSGVNGFDADSWGATLGVDGEVSPALRAGIGAFYVTSDVEENGALANSSNDITGYGLTTYMTWRPSDWYVNGALGYGVNSYESNRNSLGGVNVADYDGSQIVARIEVGRMFTSGQWDVTPNAGLRYNRVDIDAYTETGPLPISVNAQTVDSLRAVAGVNVRYTALLEGGGKLIPELGVKLLGELADPDNALTGQIVGGGAFVTRQTARDDVSFGLGAGITWEASDKVSFRLTYDGEFQSDYDEQSLAAAFRFAF